MQPYPYYPINYHLAPPQHTAHQTYPMHPAYYPTYAYYPYNHYTPELLQQRTIQTTKWILPPLTTKYDQMTFLTSHNSYSSFAYGYTPYGQQRLSISDQLKQGVRGLMLDTFSVGIGKSKKIRLCHKDCTLSSTILKRGRTETLVDITKKEIVPFLKDNTSEVITIIYEDYVNNPDFFDQELEKSGISSYILKPTDWNPDQKKGWPTLEWMKSSNKRVVMFTSTPVTQKGYTSKYLFPQWENMVENQYSTLDVNKLINERSDSAKKGKETRYLYAFNYFPDFPIPLDQIKKFVTEKNEFTDIIHEFFARNNFSNLNSNGLREALSTVVSQGLINPSNPSHRIAKNRYPNFICIDFIDSGSALQLVNEMNQKAGNSELYRSIQK